MKLKKEYSLVVIIIFLGLKLSAQTTFDRIFTGNGEGNWLRMVQERDEGGYFMLGGATREGVEVKTITQLDESGNFLREKVYPTPPFPDYLNFWNVSKITNGYVFTSSYDATLSLTKFNHNSEIEWEYDYLLFGEDTTIYDLNTLVTINQEVIITGRRYESGGGSKRMFTAKLSLQGDIIQIKDYTGQYPSEYRWDIDSIPNSSGYLMTGNPQGFGNKSCFLKLSDELDVEQIYETNITDPTFKKHMWLNSALEFLSDTTFVYSSGAVHIGSNPVDEFVCLQIYDTAFNKLNEVLLGNVGEVEYLAVSGLAFNGTSIYVGAISPMVGFNPNVPNYNMLTKLDVNLNVIWTKFYGGDANHWLSSVVDTQDGGCILMSNIFRAGADRRDVRLIKVDADGNLVTSTSSLGIITKEQIIYPNPGNTELHIKTAIQKLGGKFILSDISGKIILQTTINEQEISLNTQNLASGVYFHSYFYENKKVESGKWVKE